MSVSIQIGRCIAMPDDVAYGGILLLQFGDELLHGLFLCRCSCVCGLSVGVQTTYVAYSDTLPVPTVAVGTLFFYGAALFNGSVQADDTVVTYLFESASAVPLVYVGCCKVHSATCSGAVDDDRVYCSHAFCAIKRFVLKNGEG